MENSDGNNTENIAVMVYRQLYMNMHVMCLGGRLYYEVSGLSKMLYVFYSLALMNFIINVSCFWRSAYSVCIGILFALYVCTWLVLQIV